MTSSTPPPLRESAAQIDEDAAGWVARLAGREPTAEEEAELAAWTLADPRRAGAYARAWAGSLHLDRVVALGPAFPAESAADPQPRPVSRRRLLQVAGMVGIAAAGGTTYLLTDRPERIVAERGDVRRTVLADGSALTLNSDTRIAVSLGRTARRIVLDRGEVLFDVAHDPARPFTVVVGALAVKAIGTSFSVRRGDDDGIAVLVREGVVQVMRGGRVIARAVADTWLTAGPDHGLSVSTLDADAVVRRLAWREGMLDLTGLTLGEAAAEYRRYSDYAIRIDDPGLAARHVTGTFSTGDPRGFAEAAALSLGLRARPATNGIAIEK